MLMLKRLRGEDDTVPYVPAAGGGPLGQYTQEKTDYIGVPQSASRAYMDMLLRTPNIHTLYFGGLTRENASNRHFKMVNSQPATGDCRWPLHVHSMTTRPALGISNAENVSNNSYEMRQSGAAPNNIFFEALSGTSSANTTLSLPELWRTNYRLNATHFSNAPMTRLRSVDCTLYLQGYRNVPTRWTIWIVRPLQRDMDPHVINAQTGERNAEVNQVYTNLVRRDLVNPIMTFPAMVKTYGRLHVIHTKTIHMAPDSTDNADTRAPRLKYRFRYFPNWNCDWSWTEAMQPLTYKELDEPKWTPAQPHTSTGPSVPSTDVALNNLRRDGQNLWLLIKVNSYTENLGENDMPSYDMMMQMSHVIGPG